MGIVCIFAWSIVFSFIIFVVLYLTKLLRVNLSTEILGSNFEEFSDINMQKKELEVVKGSRELVVVKGSDNIERDPIPTSEV